MTIEEMQDVLELVSCLDYHFEIREQDNEHPALVAWYMEADTLTGVESRQTTRKWQLSLHMVKSELVQTALACVLMSLEHRAREHFSYKGEAVYGPHFDVDALYELAQAKRLDLRPEPIAQVH